VFIAKLIPFWASLENFTSTGVSANCSEICFSLNPNAPANRLFGRFWCACCGFTASLKRVLAVKFDFQCWLILCNFKKFCCFQFRYLSAKLMVDKEEETPLCALLNAANCSGIFVGSIVVDVAFTGFNNGQVLFQNRHLYGIY
jgi:hypothetical protein